MSHKVNSQRRVRLRVREYLDKHGLSAYRVAASGEGRLSRNTAYRLARNDSARIDLKSLATLATILEELTDEIIHLEDLVVLECADTPPLQPARKITVSAKASSPTLRAKVGGPNPCRTKPDEERSCIYREIYTSATAAAFANVPKATVYRALREGQLHRVGKFIKHVDLTKWMEHRGFPIPINKSVTTPQSHILKPKEAAELAGVDLKTLKLAVSSGLLSACGPGATLMRFEHPEVMRWIECGKPMPTSPPPKIRKGEAQVLQKLLAEQRLYRERRRWFIELDPVPAYDCQDLESKRLIKWWRYEYARITDTGRDALAAHLTGRAVPTGDEAELIQEAGKYGGLIRLVNTEEMTQDQTDLEMECLRRGWVVWDAGRLQATTVGLAALTRLPS